jgi:ceramide glucosyltransferase
MRKVAFDLVIAGLVFQALAVVGIAYALAAAWLAGRFGPPTLAVSGQAAAARPSISILKPLFGDEPGLRENLESFLDQAYDAPVEMVLGLQDAADPALGVAQALAAAHPGRVTVVVDAREHGLNRKVSNLINLTGKARHELLIQSDSDIAVDRFYLARIVAGFADPGVGLVTSLYRGEARAGAWSRLAAMNLSYGFLPSVVVGVSLGLARPCMGSTIALRRQTLDRIGGFEIVADVLADDYEIGRAVRALGLRTVLASGAVVHACAERGLGEFWRHELRWAMTVREIDAPGFFGSFVTHALPLAMIGAGLAGASPAAWGVVAAALAARLTLKRRIDIVFEASSGPWWMLPGRDMVAFVVMVAACFTRTVDWRGARYSVTSGGTLAAADPLPRVG